MAMRAWIAGAALLATLGATVAWAQGQPPVVAERREGLRAMGAHSEAMQAIARAGGDPRPAVARIEEMERFFAGFPARFPAGTQQGAPGVDSRALPAIWTDRANFERLNANLLPRLAALKEVAQAGNASAFPGALQQMGAACGECHRSFRAR